MLSKPLLRNYKRQECHILWVYWPSMGPIHCDVIFTFDLDIMTFTLKILSGLLIGLEIASYFQDISS